MGGPARSGAGRSTRPTGMTRASACAAPCRQDLRSCPAHHKRYTRPPWGAENRVTVFENAKGLARSGGGRPTPAGADAPGHNGDGYGPLLARRRSPPTTRALSLAIPQTGQARRRRGRCRGASPGPDRHHHLEGPAARALNAGLDGRDAPQPAPTLLGCSTSHLRECDHSPQVACGVPECHAGPPAADGCAPAPGHDHRGVAAVAIGDRPAGAWAGPAAGPRRFLQAGAAARAVA